MHHLVGCFDGMGMFGSNDRGKIAYSCHYIAMDDQSSVITHNYYDNNDRVDQ